MGYKPKRTLYNLTFEDPELEGLKVTTKSLPVDSLLEMLELADQADGEKPDMAAIEKLLGRFARVLVSWNVEEDDDTPVPATKEGLLGQDIDFLLQIITAWAKAMVQAPPPLPGASPSGATSPEESLQLASQSSSLPS